MGRREADGIKVKKGDGEEYQVVGNFIHPCFKDTFMFYHTDINDRIMELAGVRFKLVNSLQTLAGHAVFSSRQHFYRDPAIPPRILQILTELADQRELCDKCSRVLVLLDPRYRVYKVYQVVWGRKSSCEERKGISLLWGRI